MMLDTPVWFQPQVRNVVKNRPCATAAFANNWIGQTSKYLRLKNSLPHRFSGTEVSTWASPFLGSVLREHERENRVLYVAALELQI
jgi:hypothetical protein